MANEFPFDHFLKLGNQSNGSEIISNQLALSKESTSLDNSNFQNDELIIINNEILNHLKTVVPELKFKTYFENNLELKGICDKSVQFEVKTAFIKKSVDQYKEEISFIMFSVHII